MLIKTRITYLEQITLISFGTDQCLFQEKIKNTDYYAVSGNLFLTTK